MKAAILAVAGIVGLALAPTAQAVDVPTATVTGIHNVQRVAEGCGYGYHWVERYRDRNGRWVEGHCERNR